MNGAALDHKECEDEFKEMWFRAGLRGCNVQRPALPVYLDQDRIEKFLVHRKTEGACENYLYLLRRNLTWWLRLLDSRDLHEVDEAEISRLVLLEQRAQDHFHHQRQRPFAP